MFKFIKTIETVVANLEIHLQDLETLERNHLESALTHAKNAAISEEARLAAGVKAALANSIASRIRSILGQ